MIFKKREWDNTPDDNKKVYDSSNYMVYKEDDGMCFGSVKALEEDSIISFRRLIKYIKRRFSNGESLRDNIFHALKYDNRQDVPSIEEFIKAASLALQEKYQFKTVAFYQVKPSEGSGLHAEPIILETKLKDESLQGRFRAYNIPLNIPSRFGESLRNKKSFFGRDGRGYKPTDVDKRIEEIFGTSHYSLLAIKGAGGEVIGWFYMGHRDSQKPFNINKDDIRYITEIISAKLQMISWYEASMRNERINIIDMFCDEIRNPLTSIGGFSRLLLKKGHDNNLKEYASIIATEISKAEEIINIFSDLTKPELKANPAAVNVYNLIAEAVEDARTNGEEYEIAQRDKNIEMWVDPVYAKKATLHMSKKIFFDTGELNVDVRADKSFVYIDFHHPYIRNIRCGKNDFNPFCTKLDVSKETCLSLAATQKYASATGDLLYEQHYEKGTIFTIKFPVYNGGKNGK